MMTNNRRRAWRRAAGMMLAMVLGLAGTGLSAPMQEPESFRLVSAQAVKSSDDRPPLLRLAANGPIAFQVLTPAESGLPADSPRLAVRLFGVRPGEVATLEGLEPFSLVATPAENGALLLVTLAGLTPEAHLRVRAGQRTNELEIVAAAAPAQ